MKLNIKDILQKVASDIVNHPAVQKLLEIIANQSKKIEELEEEIRRLKCIPGKPNIKPSGVEKNNMSNRTNPKDKRPGSEKRSKTKEKKDFQDIIIEPENVQKDWKFKDYNDYHVQELELRVINLRFKLKTYITPEGDYKVGKLPKEYEGTHFGPVIHQYIIHQYHHCRVTEPLLLEQLHEIGLDISAGTLNEIICGKEIFHIEKEELLQTGISLSDYIQSDDTGARHKGKNGYCTVIANEYFTYFKSCDTKSRINFLEILRTSNYEDYCINQYALDYMRAQGMPRKYLFMFEFLRGCIYVNKTEWVLKLEELEIKVDYAKRIATEGALVGSLMEHEINKNIAVISDDAGQFNILQHGLCWIHTERNIQKIHCFTDEHEKLLEDKLKELWQFYKELKTYKLQPCVQKKGELEKKFNDIFQNPTGFFSLDQVLEKVVKNKDELLLVLNRPEIPLHNNTSERDIREYVIKRKISGSTRSNHGRSARDTFASLKKTCRKLNISFWKYLEDRFTLKNEIPNLAESLAKKLTVQLE
ncbi:hypothetical protein ES708_12718 [subsurface metagenome]